MAWGGEEGSSEEELLGISFASVRCDHVEWRDRCGVYLHVMLVFGFCMAYTHTHTHTHTAVHIASSP